MMSGVSLCFLAFHCAPVGRGFSKPAASGPPSTNYAPVLSPVAAWHIRGCRVYARPRCRYDVWPISRCHSGWVATTITAQHDLLRSRKYVEKEPGSECTQIHGGS